MQRRRSPGTNLLTLHCKLTDVIYLRQPILINARLYSLLEAAVELLGILNLMGAQHKTSALARVENNSKVIPNIHIIL